MKNSASMIFLCIATFILLIFNGCARKAATTGETGAGTGVPLEQVQGQKQAGAGGGNIQEGVVGGEGIREPGSQAAISEGRTSAPFLPIYFDFDRYTIRPDMISRMEHNAKVMLDHPDIKVEIQGNCDERGTNEYNLALGEKRAKAARDYMVNMGVDPGRITIVSLGEEKPLDPGHNEKAWAKNRRDDFIVYR